MGVTNIIGGNKLFIYESTNQKTGKKYVGSCSRPEHKAKHYFGSARSILADIKANGHEHYSKKVLSKHDNKAEMKEAEYQWHKKLDVVNDSSYLNKTYGAENYGTLGYKWTGEQSRNLSKAQTGIKMKPTTKKLHSNRMKGHVPTELCKARGRLTKARNAVRDCSGIRKRGNSWCLRIFFYGTEINESYNGINSFEDVRQSYRDRMRSVISHYEDDVKRLEQDEMIKNLDKDITIIPWEKPVLKMRGYTQAPYNPKLYNAQYAFTKNGKTICKSLGVHPSKYSARLKCLKWWNMFEKIGWTNAELVDQNIEYFKSQNEKKS